VLALACTSAPPELPLPVSERADPAKPGPRVLSIVGTNDVHGRLESLPIFGGFVANLRAQRAQDGALLLVDAGDMFQGTLASNMNEGATMVEAYHALGYAAAAIGNHDFDYGPVGEADAGDPQGALRARIESARFAMLSANLVESRSKQPVSWRGLERSKLLELTGMRIGLIGVLSEETPQIVMPAFFAGLDVSPIVTAVRREATALRASGAELVVLVAHAGGSCTRFGSPEDSSSCDPDSEIIRVLRSLPAGDVDAVIGAHTHQAMAHFIAGVPVAQAYAHGRAFSRIDLLLDERARVERVEIHPPTELCPGGEKPCEPGDYAGARVARDARVAELIAPALERAQQKRDESLAVRVTAAVRESFSDESALGNLFADLLRQSIPKADVGLMNGGGLRASLNVGELSYGELYEAMPFDNRLALVRLSGKRLRAVIEAHLTSARHGIISVSGISVRARCAGGRVQIELRRANGAVVRDDDQLVIATSDYLATGGDDLLRPAQLEAGRVEILAELVRDAFAARLRARGGTLDGGAPALLDPARPRLGLPAKRPLRCQ
jgi:2',3'-cyclic-nucleotide 2'-phosphodiesterase (5'-nucleotidase family)